MPLSSTLMGESWISVTTTKLPMRPKAVSTVEMSPNWDLESGGDGLLSTVGVVKERDPVGVENLGALEVRIGGRTEPVALQRSSWKRRRCIHGFVNIQLVDWGVKVVQSQALSQDSQSEQSNRPRYMANIPSSIEDPIPKMHDFGLGFYGTPLSGIRRSLASFVRVKAVSEAISRFRSVKSLRTMPKLSKSKFREFPRCVNPAKSRFVSRSRKSRSCICSSSLRRRDDDGVKNLHECIGQTLNFCELNEYENTKRLSF